MPLKTLTFLFTEKKKSKVVCIKKEIRARTAKHSLFWTLITEGTHNCNRFWIHVVKSVISSRPNAYQTLHPHKEEYMAPFPTPPPPLKYNRLPSYPSLWKNQHVDQAPLLYRSWNPYHGISQRKPNILFHRCIKVHVKLQKFSLTMKQSTLR